MHSKNNTYKFVVSYHTKTYDTMYLEYMRNSTNKLDILSYSIRKLWLNDIYKCSLLWGNSSVCFVFFVLFSSPPFPFSLSLSPSSHLSPTSSLSLSRRPPSFFFSRTFLSVHGKLFGWCFIANAYFERVYVANKLKLEHHVFYLDLCICRC